MSVTLADGPGGLRLVRKTAVSKRGRIKMFKGHYLLSFMEVMPDWALFFLKPGKNDTVFYQFATAFPVGTNLASTWNTDIVEKIGYAVSKEMDKYNVTYWLAPGMNIQRNPLCGRNFEYYSEDPVVSGKISAAMTRGVQRIEGNYTTIKHFACNNQETNRLNNNSIVSEKAMREIYLLAFEKAIKWSNPLSIMTSYNLVNGIHSAEHHGLIIDILRDEWNYKGLVMTDWATSGQSYRKNNKYPNAYASRDIKNGNNICMPGGKSDIKDIKAALKSGYLSRQER
jgi:beta-glucosidase